MWSKGRIRAWCLKERNWGFVPEGGILHKGKGECFVHIETNLLLAEMDLSHLCGFRSPLQNIALNFGVSELGFEDF